MKLTYGADISHETVANITDAINDTVKEWRNRPLDDGPTLLHTRRKDLASLLNRRAQALSRGAVPVYGLVVGYVSPLS